jgi:hypothetical protein
MRFRIRWADAPWALLVLLAAVLTALPAVVVGGLSMEMPDGLVAHLAAVGLVPAALTAMLAELLSPGAVRADVSP